MKLISQHTVISILVRDQDEALHFYTEKLGLEVRNDITYGPGLRLLLVAPHGQMKPALALARPAISLHGPERVQELMEHIGCSVSSVFVTDNCLKEYNLLLERGVRFASAPKEQLYGLEAVFEDPYGNAFSLLEASPEAHSLFERRNISSAA